MKGTPTRQRRTLGRDNAPADGRPSVRVQVVEREKCLEWPGWWLEAYDCGHELVTTQSRPPNDRRQCRLCTSAQQREPPVTLPYNARQAAVFGPGTTNGAGLWLGAAADEGPPEGQLERVKAVSEWGQK